MERKLFTHLTGRRAPALHALLSDNGFRRSQNLIYRPACEGCAACQSVRIVAREFEFNGRYQRILKLNDDIEVAVRQPRATAEQFALFKRYLDARHTGGGMTAMSFVDYEYMVEDTPVQTVVVEYRLGERPREAAGRGGADRRDARRAVDGLFVLRPRTAQTRPRQSHHPRPHSTGAARRPQLCVSRLLGAGLAEDGLQGRSSGRSRCSAARWAGGGSTEVHLALHAFSAADRRGAAHP